MDYFCLTVISFVFGTIYYNIMSSSIPKDSNCSFVANVWTDILAFIVGAYVAHIAQKRKEPLLFICGIGIITEHIWQLFHHKLK